MFEGDIKPQQPPPPCAVLHGASASAVCGAFDVENTLAHAARTCLCLCGPDFYSVREECFGAEATNWKKSNPVIIIYFKMLIYPYISAYKIIFIQ